jgi:hypothetical protein
MALFVATQPSHVQRNGRYNKTFWNRRLMQHEMAPRTRRRYRTGLFSLAGTDRFAHGQHGSRQIENNRFLGQHDQALENVRRGRLPSVIGKIVVNHVGCDLGRLSHPSVRWKPVIYAKKSGRVATTESVLWIKQ